MAKEPNLKTTLPFGAVLNRLMSDRGLTPAQISALAGVSRSVVGDWLNGAAPRDLAAVGKLARALGISMRELLLNEPEELAPAEPGRLNVSEVFEELPFIDGVFRISVHRVRNRILK